MTPSERFVADLCEKSFLPFWSFPSPLRKKDKELCDILVVCGDDIIIISVKDIKVSSHSNPEVQYQRWQRGAVEDSIKQIYGAERFLEQVFEIEVKGKTFRVPLPEKRKRRIYRIAIAFGSDGRFPLVTGDFGKGFVHVFDEESTFTVLNELDTVGDFISYLKAKEDLFSSSQISVPREVDFLALYINTGLDFDGDPDSLVIESGLWDTYVKTTEYKKWQKDISDSFVWDEIVKQLHQNHIVEKQRPDMRSDLERATRIITLENRMNRIELAMTLKDAIVKGVSGRMIRPLPGSEHCYVFMPLGEKNWQSKESELQLRCMIARKENPQATKVIGLGIGTGPDGTSVFDLAFFDIPEMNDELLKRIEHAKNELGLFKNPVVSRSRDLRKS